jgi:hypothetical protein
MAIFFHAAMNASSELWKTIPAYSVRPPTAAEAIAVNVHTNLMTAIVLWVAAVVVVLAYGSRNLSRKPRYELADAGDGPRTRVQ